MANVKITQLPSGSYNAKVYDYTTADGKRKYKSITASSKSEVKRQIAVFLADREALREEREKKKSPDYMTVGEAIDRYIESKSNVLSPSTVREYKQTRRNAFKNLMTLRLEELTSDLVQFAVNDTAIGRSPKTVRNYYGLLSSALAVYAPSLRLDVLLPKKVKPDIIIPTEDEITQVFAAVKGKPVEVAVYLAALCGMRRSEIAALKWEDVDLEKNTISIHAAKVYDENHDYVLKSTKTTAGKRTIMIFTPAAEFLRTLPHDSEYVCTLKPAQITDHFFAALDRGKVRHFRFHDLRHYTVSVMLSLNMPKKYIADYVGHENERMIEQVYGHIMQGAKDSFLTAVDGYFVKQMHHEMQHD